VVEGDNAPSEVEAHISPDNLIDVKARNVKKLRLLLRPELFHSAAPTRVRLNGKDQPPLELKRDCQLFLRSADAYATLSRLHRRSCPRRPRYAIKKPATPLGQRADFLICGSITR
jgi:hypothetical protein